MAKPAPAPRRVEYMRLDEIQRAPRNPKAHDRDGINASIEEHGLAELPLLDERTERLVAGHGRLTELEAKHAAGDAAPDGVLVDADGMWKMPVIRGWASKSDAHAESYLLASNRTAMNGGWNDTSLAEMLGDLAKQDFDLALVAGWDAGALEDLMSVAELAPPQDFAPIDFSSAGGDAPAERSVPAAPAPAVKVHDTVPATSAEYAETPEQEAARQEQLARQTPRYASGLVEMILIYTDEDRAEVGRLINAGRGALGGDLKAAEVVLRALRTLVSVLDYKDTGVSVDMAKLARAAGWEQA